MINVAKFNAAYDALPALIDRAANALTSARSSAEVLEARDMASVAYDAAKSAGRIARAKHAHDEVVAAVYRAQADAAGQQASQRQAAPASMISSGANLPILEIPHSRSLTMKAGWAGHIDPKQIKSSSVAA